MKGVSKGIPFIGDIVVGIDEFADVGRGRQTITAATIRTLGQFGAGIAGTVMGSAALGTAGGAVGGSLFGLPGAAVGGGVGTAIGGLVGDWWLSDQSDHHIQAFLEHTMPDDINPEQNQARAGNAHRIE
jgi:hypothetical protein